MCDLRYRTKAKTILKTLFYSLQTNGAWFPTYSLQTNRAWFPSIPYKLIEPHVFCSNPKWDIHENTFIHFISKAKCICLNWKKRSVNLLEIDTGV